jgi:hypothetical protein
VREGKGENKEEKRGNGVCGKREIYVLIQKKKVTGADTSIGDSNNK